MITSPFLCREPQISLSQAEQPTPEMRGAKKRITRKNLKKDKDRHMIQTHHHTLDHKPHIN